MKPTPKEIRLLHDWLKKEMPFVFSGFQQQWEIRKEEKCPSQGVLWVNRDYVQNAEDLTEIVNAALLLHPHISKIEMYSFADDEVYAKLGILGQHCLILKECVLEILKDLQFTIDTNANNLSVNITQKSTNKTTILSYPYRQITENFKKALGIIFSHVISLKPTANDSKAVENIYGTLDEDTKLMVQELLNTEFGNAFIHEEKDYYLNPFACYLKDNFPEYGIPMWLLQQGYKEAASDKKSTESFINYLDFENVLQFRLITLKEYQDSNDTEKKQYQKRKTFYLREWLKDDYWRDSASEVLIGNEYKKICDLKEEERQPYTVVEIDKINDKKFKDEVIGYVFPDLSVKNEIPEKIKKDERFWIFNIDRFVNLIRRLKKNEETVQWQVNKDKKIHFKTITETLEKMSSDQTSFEEIKELASKIRYGAPTNNHYIRKEKLEMILSVLLSFIKEHTCNWTDIVIQCIERYAIQFPDNVNTVNVKTSGVCAMLLRLDPNIEKNMDAKIRKAYIDDILSTYQSIKEPYVKGLITQFIYKRTDSGSPLSEESKHATDSMTNYDQSGAIKQTIYEEVANME